MLTIDTYFDKLGFFEDPFAHTNALHEDMLKEYFITPPYYYSLVGSFKTPKSSIVLAPRGTGKTAQRIMLQNIAEKQKDFIAVVYDDFPIEGMKSLSSITLEKHLIRIIKHLTIALLLELNGRGGEELLSNHQKRFLKQIIKLYISGITNAEVTQSIKSIKGITGQALDVWEKVGKPFNSIINAILQKNGISNIDITTESKEAYKVKLIDINSHLDFLEQLFYDIGIHSIFILIDRVDETNLTGNDAKKSYTLIKPLINDLRILERKHLVFKFFLWDKIQEYWSNEIRTDRIEIYKTEWNSEEIKELLKKRLLHYSNSRISSLEDVLDCDLEKIELIFLFSNNSPRDLINILKSIFDIHLSTNNTVYFKPSEDSIIKGIEEFCKSKFEELISITSKRTELKRIKQSTFTIPFLTNEVFKSKSTFARNKLMPWTRSGIVYTADSKYKIGSSNNGINVYTFADIRIAREICSNQKFNDFIERNLLICSECQSVNVFDKHVYKEIRQWQCKKCSADLL